MVLTRSVEIADELQIKHVIVVFDQAIYAKAQEIHWSNTTFKQRLGIHLGAFHTSMSFLAIIGKCYCDGGLFDIFVESGRIVHVSGNAVMERKQYNRAIHAHKLMYEALGRLRFQAFADSLTNEQRQRMVKFINYALDAFASALFKNLCHGDEATEILTAYGQFVQQQSNTNRTFAFRSSYIDMVQLLLQFTGTSS